MALFHPELTAKRSFRDTEGWEEHSLVVLKHQIKVGTIKCALD